MLRELLASFDIDTGRAAAALQQIDGALSKTKGTLGALADAFIGSALVGGMKSFVQDQIDAAKEVRLTAQKLGVSTEMLQEFQFAAGAMGVSAEGAATGLKFLNKNIGLALGGNEEAAKTFGKLGVQLKNADGTVRELGDVLPEVADKFQGMGSQQERTAAAMELFGRQGADMLPLLQDGAKGVDALRERFHELGGGMSTDFIARAKEAGRAMGATKFGLTAFKREIVYEALPAVTRIAKIVQGWTANLIRLSRQTNVARYAAVALGGATAVASARAAVGFSKLLGVVPKDAGFWKAALGLGEIGLVVAAVAFLALAFEDLFVFMQGGDSVIGDLMTKFLGVEEAANFSVALNQAWDSISQTFRGLLPTLTDVVSVLLKAGVQVAPILVSALNFVVRVLASAVTLLAAFVETLTKIPEAIKKGDFSVISKVVDRAGDAVFGRKGLFDLSSSNSLADYGVPAENIGTIPSTRSPTSFSRGATVTQTNKVNVTVQGGQTPQETAARVKGGVQGALDGELQAAMAAAIGGG